MSDPKRKRVAHTRKSGRTKRVNLPSTTSDVNNQDGGPPPRTSRQSHATNLPYLTATDLRNRLEQLGMKVPAAWSRKFLLQLYKENVASGRLIDDPSDNNNRPTRNDSPQTQSTIQTPDDLAREFTTGETFNPPTTMTTLGSVYDNLHSISDLRSNQTEVPVSNMADKNLRDEVRELKELICAMRQENVNRAPHQMRQAVPSDSLPPIDTVPEAIKDKIKAAICVW